MPVEKNDLLRLRLHGDIRDLLNRELRGEEVIHYRLSRRASIKDIIESLGIPHTEIGAIATGDRQLDFFYIPESGEQIDIWTNSRRFPPTAPAPLRPEPLPSCRFLVDINAARCAGLLRMAGFDTASVRESAALCSKTDIADSGVAEKRILISRDRELLKLRQVVFGRLLRAQHPYDQLVEIIELYGLHSELAPFSRCMKCNHLLTPVAKETIMDRLEPLTKRYYSSFKQCGSCSSIYWQGSHHQHMLKRLEPLLINQKSPGEHGK